MATKFTFKTHKQTGLAAIGDKPSYSIKLKQVVVGDIIDIASRQAFKSLYKVRFMVIKKDPNEDKCPNCPWKWITIKNDFEDLEAAKEFVTKNADQIVKSFPLYIEPQS